MARTHQLAILLPLLAANTGAAQDGCQPWFKHQQIDTFYSGGFAIVDLDPAGWPSLVGNAWYRGLEMWRFGPGGEVAPLGTVSQDLANGLLAADFDGDGDTDLVARHMSSDSLHVFKNAGGTLTEGPGTRVPGIVRAHCAPDLDGDGLADLVVTTTDEILVLRNAGDGTFLQSNSLEFEQVYGVVPAAIDQDGLPDLLVFSIRNATPVRQRPDGSLLALASVGLSYTGGELPLTGDINGDGLTDILDEQHHVLLAAGQGQFDEGEPLSDRVERLIGLADLDRDGDRDLLVNARDAAGLYSAYAMLNDGAGRFGFVDHPGILTLYEQPSDTLIADVNHDGYPDVFAQRDRHIDLRFGNGDGSFDDVSFHLVSKGTLRRVTLGDIDGDGDLDAVATGDDPGPTIKVLTNDGTGSFEVGAVMALPSLVYERAALADFDLDGRPDILAWTEADGLWLFRNTPDGRFSEIRVLDHHAGAPTRLPFAADLDADGLPDILAGDSEAAGYVIYLNRGGWSFERSLIPEPAARHILAVADFDNDGISDVLCDADDPEDNELLLCRGLGAGEFSPPAPTGVVGEPQAYATPGDFNGDGWLDFASFAWLSRDVQIMTNRTDGSFGPTATLEYLAWPRDPGVADLDADGVDELIIAAQSPDKAAVFFFNAAGELRSQALFGNGAGAATGTPVGDLNGDGATDTLIPARRGLDSFGGISVFLNQCPGAPCLADIDHDGDTDTQDVLAFLIRWLDQQHEDCSAGACTADLDRNRLVDTRDFVRFLSAWAAGC